jgi:outer membrane protein OmpA-like peptidoglycan-associated protein
MQKLLTILLVTFAYACSTAQPTYNYGTKDKKAIKSYETAQGHYNSIDPNTGRRNWKDAEKHANEAIARDSNFLMPYTLLTKIYNDTYQYDKALAASKKMLQISPDYSQAQYFYTADFAMNCGAYEDVLKYSKRYISFQGTNDVLFSEAKRYVANAEFALEALKNPYPYKLVNLGKGVNTDRDEYFPSLTADDELLLFTRNIKDQRAMAGQGIQEDIFVSRITQDGWSKAVGISPNINTEFNEGAPTFSADGKYIIFVGCEAGPYGYGGGRTGMGSCDLFFSEKVGNTWSRPFNLGYPINTANWETQPSFSSDGKTLYFIRGEIVRGERRSPKNQDIYEAHIQDDGTWSTPKKLNISTPYREESVFIHPDGQTLYFSSEGYPGMGGLDIFMSRKQPDGSWGKPINLGYPINTHNDENSLLVNSKGELAYFASDRPGGEGNLDLYSFELPQEFRPFQTLALKGKIYDAETKEPLEAHFELIDIATGELFKEAYANRGNGEFLVAMPINKNFALVATHKGYQLFSKNYSLSEGQIGNKEFLIEVPMQPIGKAGTTFVLENVFFDTDSYALKQESKAELDRLSKILKDNPSIKIEIGGHTDSDGDDARNQKLSENRAKAVVDFLLAKGIAKERLSFKGYGETKPIAPNDTPQNKAKNRRTEVKVQ